MRLLRHQLDPKSRRILAAGNRCLAFGLMLTISAEVLRHCPAVFHGLPTLLIGLAIILLFWSARRSRDYASRF